MEIYIYRERIDKWEEEREMEIGKKNREREIALMTFPCLVHSYVGILLMRTIFSLYFPGKPMNS